MLRWERTILNWFVCSGRLFLPSQTFRLRCVWKKNDTISACLSRLLNFRGSFNLLTVIHCPTPPQCPEPTAVWYTFRSEIFGIGIWLTMKHGNVSVWMILTKPFFSCHLPVFGMLTCCGCDSKKTGVWRIGDSSQASFCSWNLRKWGRAVRHRTKGEKWHTYTSGSFPISELIRIHSKYGLA